MKEYNQIYIQPENIDATPRMSAKKKSKPFPNRQAS